MMEQLIDALINQGGVGILAAAALFFVYLTGKHYLKQTQQIIETLKTALAEEREESKSMIKMIMDRDIKLGETLQQIYENLAQLNEKLK